MPGYEDLLEQQQRQIGALEEQERKVALEIATRFGEAAALPDCPQKRSVLLAARGGAFALEKKALPRVCGQAGGSCDALFTTVGMTEEPVILTLLCTRPRLAFLFHTEASRKKAELVAQDPDVQGAGTECAFVEITEYEVPRNYHAADEALARAQRRFPSGIRLAVDPTGGTKMMVASLATWAFYHRVPITYLYCPAEMGVPVPFAGRLERIENPYEHFADIEVEQIVALGKQGYYEAALELCRSVAGQVADLAVSRKLQILEKWLDLCRRWDAFAHSDPNPETRPDLAREAEEVISALARFRVADPDAQQRQRNLQFLRDMPAPPRGAANVCDLHRLADIWAQAERRAEQGKYDDAMARLYRITEMALAIRLQAFGLGATDRPDWQKVKQTTGKSYDELREAVEALPTGRAGVAASLPREYLGLASLASVLAVLDHDFGNTAYAAVRAKLAEGGAFQRRNRSVLAHGTMPLSAEDSAQAARDVCFVLCKILGKEQYARAEELREKARPAPPPW